MQKRWVIRDADTEAVERLQQALNIPAALAMLLVQRGITTFEDARRFFRPSLEHLHDPFLMKDMDKAVDRILRALRSHEKILIYGDYDVDGTTSVALAYSFFKELGADVDYYVPNRYSEGYGISLQGIDYAHTNGFKLVIALDCGIKAADKIEYASQRHIDFIICDHHLPDENIPKAVAVLDPKRTDCHYPYKELSGCGIGFKLISAVARKKHLGYDSVNKYLDFVVVSIAADIVPITGENRVLAYYGLQRLNKEPSEGLRALIELNQLKKPLTVSDLVFIVGPRINAAGRMDDARHAVRLLVSGIEQASSHAQVLNKHNTDRKGFDSSITQEAIEMLQNDPEQESRKTTVIFKSDWHKGVIGIVASRLIDLWYRPTIVFTESNGIIAGSARSVPGFDIYEAIYACRDLLEQFGGHMFAAGITMKRDNLDAFRRRFEEVVATSIDERLLIPEIEINATLDPADVTPKFYNILRQFGPFGPQNMKPLFVTQGVVDNGWTKVVGSDHIRFYVKKNEANLQGVGFGMAEHISKIKSGEPFDICYSLEENEWNGRKRIEMLVKDIK
ncbi:MAG: single-stranded-DNA-specific exonuclease RecJ [Chitinophagales bacterium]|nr:single-stranded-DNA-specific exonuclease RecJ [Chitinophagales bacterium]